MGLSVVGNQFHPGIRDVRSSGLYRSQRWYAGYLAALFEIDRAQIVGRIREAELLILSRQRELQPGESDSGEQRALNNALHALRTWRTYLAV